MKKIAKLVSLSAILLIAAVVFAVPAFASHPDARTHNGAICRESKVTYVRGEFVANTTTSTHFVVINEIIRPCLKTLQKYYYTKKCADCGFVYTTCLTADGVIAHTHCPSELPDLPW